MTLLALPDPKELTLADTREVCAHVIQLANDCDDLEMVMATKDAFQAFAEYLRLHDAAREGEATLRYLESRCGELLGPASPTAGPGRGKPSTMVDGLSRDQRSDFRQMAANPEVVDRVVEESTEQSPASRAKVLNAIKELEQVAKQAAVERKQWNDGLREQREWAATFKAKPGDDWRRRDKTEGAMCGLLAAVESFTEAVTPDDMAHALETGLAYMADGFRKDLTLAFEQLDEYRKAIQ